MSAGNRLLFARDRRGVLPTESVLRVAVWCAFLVVISFTSADPDLWGHVRFGLDILRDANIHQVDAYSFASDRVWVNHEWGAEVITASAFAIGGSAGLVALKMLIVGATLMLLNAVLRREGVDSPFARDGAAAAAIITTLSQAHHVRPQLFSLLLFAILLSCLMAARRGSPRSLWMLPPLFAAWANLHGGWIVGGGVLVLWTCALLVTGERQRALWCAAAAGASLIATLATPYGFGLWRFLQETVGFSRPEILEWQPVYAVSWEFLAIWLLAFMTMGLGIALGGRDNIRLERVLVCVALAGASLKVSRLLAFFALASLFLVSAPIAHAFQRRRATHQRNRGRVLRFGFAAVACALGVFAIVAIHSNVWDLRLDAASMPEPEAVAFLKDQPAGTRVLVWFNWGEYAIWHLSPRMRVSIDGRRETVYSDAVQTRHFDFFFDRRGGATLPNDLAADYVWIPRVLPAARRLRTEGGWTILYDGKQSVIFGRTGLPLIRRVASVAAATTSRIFPGP